MQLKEPNAIVIKVKAKELAIHPHAQRDVIPSKLNRLIEGMDLDAVGVFHAVKYPIDGQEKVWVIDGQHRLLAILHHDFGDWEVEVKLHLDCDNDARASELFLKLNDRAAVSPYDKFVNEVQANNAAAIQIMRIVRTAGMEVSKTSGERKLCCISALKKLHKMDQGATLQMTLSVATSAWGFKATALEGKLIEGLGAVLGRYRLVIDKDVLIKKMSKYPGGASGIIGDARGLVEYRRTSLSRCVAERILETYNKGRENKLPPLEAATEA